MLVFWAGLALAPSVTSAEDAGLAPPEPSPVREPAPPPADGTQPPPPPVDAATAPDDVAAVPPPEPNPTRNGSERNPALADEKVAEAVTACATLLDGVAISYEHLDPIRRGPCGTLAPIKVRSFGKNPEIVVSPPATMNCTIAAALSKWFKESVQPTAEVLGTSVVKVSNAASYMCRNQYGQAGAKLSEHAKANALDISSFYLASGQRIKVLGNWPYGRRPDRPQLAGPPIPNPLRNHKAFAPKDDTAPGVTVLDDAPGDDAFSSDHDALKKVATNPFFRPLFDPTLELIEIEDEEPEGPLPAGSIGPSDAKVFLKTIHGDACKIFWTVLGPEANAAHRDHFHFDMRKRRYVKICE